MKPIILLLGLIFLSYDACSQEHLVVPRKGFTGIKVVVDSSKIDDVFDIYGYDYFVSKGRLITNFKYEDLGLTFQVDAYDKNRIVRSIFAESPFQPEFKNGLKLNVSTLVEVWDIYNDRGCILGYSSSFFTHQGISFYVKNKSNSKNCDTLATIYKVEVHNRGEYNIRSNTNFILDETPIIQKLDRIKTFIETSVFDEEELTMFMESQNTNRNLPYAFSSTVVFNRKLANDLNQSLISISIHPQDFNLNIVRKDSALVYAILEREDKDHQVFEIFGDSRSDKLDMNIYEFGTFCGYSGIPPSKCREMLDNVNKKNTELLTDWLFSQNPELSTYGYYGLMFLNINGMPKFPTSVQTRMNELSKSDIQLNTCQGCIAGVTEKIRDVLHDEVILESYNNFKEFNWLK